MKRYKVPFRLEFSGEILIEAESKVDAYNYAKNNIDGLIKGENISGLKNNSIVDFLISNKSTDTKIGFITIPRNQNSL